MDEFTPSPLPRDPRQPDNLDFTIADCPEPVQVEFKSRHLYELNQALMQAHEGLEVALVIGMISRETYLRRSKAIVEANDIVVKGVEQHVAEFHSSDVSKSSNN